MSDSNKENHLERGSSIMYMGYMTSEAMLQPLLAWQMGQFLLCTWHIDQEI